MDGGGLEGAAQRPAAALGDMPGRVLVMVRRVERGKNSPPSVAKWPGSMRVRLRSPRSPRLASATVAPAPGHRPEGTGWASARRPALLVLVRCASELRAARERCNQGESSSGGGIAPSASPRTMLAPRVRALTGPKSTGSLAISRNNFPSATTTAPTPGAARRTLARRHRLRRPQDDDRETTTVATSPG